MAKRLSLGASGMTDAKRPLSLWTRIVSLIALLLVTGTMVTGLASLLLLQRTLMQTVDDDLRKAAAPIVSADSPSQRAMALEEAADAYSPVDFIVEFHDRDGSVLHRITRQRGATPVSSVKLPELSSKQVISRHTQPFTVAGVGEHRWRVLAVAFEAPEEGSVMVALPLDNLDQNMRSMAIVVVVVGSFVVFIGMALGGYFVHLALAPLRDVETTAAQIARGDLSKRVPTTTSSYEVHQLATSLNEMLVHIEEAFAAQTASEHRAQISEAKMRRFVADASHELRTPLAAIRGFGELYRMGALPDEEAVASAMRRIEDEARRMGSLVENLLRLARLEDNPDLDLEPVDITDAIFDAAQDLRALDPSRRVIVCSLSGSPLPTDPHEPVGVMGNEAALRQVILNLVGNANRHTPKGTPVELAIGMTRTGEVAIEVRDHGEGISAADREKVFERFYRIDESRQRLATQGGGAGLGLSIAARIVQQHGGKISIHQTQGGGATFRVTLKPADLDPGSVKKPDQVRPVLDS